MKRGRLDGMVANVSRLTGMRPDEAREQLERVLDSAGTFVLRCDYPISIYPETIHRAELLAAVRTHRKADRAVHEPDDRPVRKEYPMTDHTQAAHLALNAAERNTRANQEAIVQSRAALTHALLAIADAIRDSKPEAAVTYSTGGLHLPAGTVFADAMAAIYAQDAPRSPQTAPQPEPAHEDGDEADKQSTLDRYAPKEGQ